MAWLLITRLDLELFYAIIVGKVVVVLVGTPLFVVYHFFRYQGSEDVAVDYRVTGIRDGYEDKQVVQSQAGQVMDRQDRRRVLLRCAYGLLVFSLCGLYMLSSPVTPGPVDIHVGDRYVISLLPVTALSDAPDHGFLVGNYTGHRWPGNIPMDEPARIEIAANNPWLLLLQICSHEVRHFELEQSGVTAVKHHEMMATDGTNYAYPWNWNPDCIRIIPHILY